MPTNGLTHRTHMRLRYVYYTASSPLTESKKAVNLPSRPPALALCSARSDLQRHNKRSRGNAGLWPGRVL
jgi:hypothetical protein